MLSSTHGSLAARGLSVLRRLGGWVAIHPEQTYVATSIRGIGACKSTFCPAERRDLPAAARGNLLPTIAAFAAAAGILTACASARPFGRDVTDPGQIERAPEDCQRDCQNRAARVRAAEPAFVKDSATSAAGGPAGEAAREAGPRADAGARDDVAAADFAAKTVLGEAELVAAR